MCSSWKPLQIDREDIKVPPLLIKTEFGLSSYNIWLTDLTYIWTESIDRRQIIQRAFSIDTSIDPSEDAGQLRLLLQSVEDALKERAGTSVNALQGDCKQQLILQTATPLPRSLRPLEWRIMLTSAPQTILTSELIIPLVTLRSIAKAEKASLLQQLKYKDNVISKLVENMQSDGIDLSKVFPGAAPARPGANTRHIVGRSVKGLAEFDLEQWQKQMLGDGKSFEELTDLISNVFDIDSSEVAAESQISYCPNYGEWWRRLTNDNSQDTPEASVLPNPQAEENGAAEDGFQTQLTPLKLQAKPRSSAGPRRRGQSKTITPSPHKRPEDEGSTTDSSDVVDQPSKIHTAPAQEVNKASIGYVGKRKAGAQPHPNAKTEDLGCGQNPSLHRRDTSPGIRQVSKLHGLSSSSEEDAMDATEDDLDSSKPILKGKELGQSQAIRQSKPRLGKIGGKGNIGKANSFQNTTKAEKLHVAPKANDGVNIKENKENPSPSKASESFRVGRAAVQQQASSAPRESSQERANRKRDDLKRDLESKRNVGAKKKRKF